MDGIVVDIYINYRYVTNDLFILKRLICRWESLHKHSINSNTQEVHSNATSPVILANLYLIVFTVLLFSHLVAPGSLQPHGL